MTTLRIIVSRKEGDARATSAVSIRLIVDRTPLLLPPQSLVLFIPTRSLHQTPFKATFDLSSRHHLDAGTRCCCCCWCLFTAALDPHRIIFGNYLRYSNSKRTLPFNGPEKIRVTRFSSSSWGYRRTYLLRLKRAQDSIKRYAYQVSPPSRISCD